MDSSETKPIKSNEEKENEKKEKKKNSCCDNCYCDWGDCEGCGDLLEIIFSCLAECCRCFSKPCEECECECNDDD